MQAIKLVFMLLLAGNTVPLPADDHPGFGAHEHGVGTLDIAREGAVLHIQLTSAAVNIVGFERVPETEADHEALEKALALLEDGADLFAFPDAAGCRLVDADVETPLHEHGDGEEDHRAVDPAHQASVNHRAPADAQGIEEEPHTNITATWRFSCAHSERLDRIGVQLFDTFPMTQRLRVQFVTAEHQSAADLSASQSILRF